MTLGRATRLVKAEGFGVRTAVFLNGGTVFAVEAFCPCGRWKWFRLPVDDIVRRLRAHIAFDRLGVVA